MIDPSIWRSVGGSRLDHYLYSPALGSEGGMIIGWNSSLHVGVLKFQGIYCLSVEFRCKTNNVRWVCTTVYGPNLHHLKPDFWNEIRLCYPGDGIPWVICGDFNSIFSHMDKSNGCPNLSDIALAQSFLRDLHLLESPAFGKRFTWTNGQANPIWVKLDRFLVNLEWCSLFPKTS